LLVEQRAEFIEKTAEYLKLHDYGDDADARIEVAVNAVLRELVRHRLGRGDEDLNRP
jgi:hypothetical protein